MPFPEPSFAAAHGVVRLEDPVARRPENDERFAAAIASEFPTRGHQQILPPEVPPGIPHMIIQSGSSQVAVASVQADFEVQFYGDYVSSAALCFDYINRKMLALLRGWQALEAKVAVVGLELKMHFSFSGQDEMTPIAHMLDKHVRVEFDSDSLREVTTQFGAKLLDHYFVNIALATYEARALERPIMPGAQHLVVRPWEGTVADTGLEITIDLNNRYRAVIARAFDAVDDAELGAVIDMSRRLAERCAVPYARDGVIDLATLHREPA